MSLLWTPSEHSFEENATWARVRAIEWKALPAFVSQSAIPVLLLVFNWQAIIIGFLFAALVWRFIRWHIVSIPVASISAILVVLTKWPLIIAIAVFFLYKGLWLNLIICLLTPILSIVISFVDAGGNEGFGDYEIRFMQEMGYDIPDLSKL